MTMRAFLALSSLSFLFLAACGPASSPTQAKRVSKDATLDSDAPLSLANIEFVESERGGDPAVVGCADGQREGFADLTKFPTIAGCLAVWDGEMNLRKGKTSKACGDDLDVCSSPADVCGPGWNICARDGDYHDLTDRISASQCSEGAGPGKFVAAISHVKTKGECADVPGPTTRYPCLDEGFGAEPVCCGANCGQGGCKDSVWAGETRISMGKAEGCSTVSSERNGGVLCCKDPNAPAPVPTPPPAAGEGGTAAGGTGDTGADAPADGGAADGTAPAGAVAGDPTGSKAADSTKRPDPAKKADDKKADAKKAD